jgi:hypothetical protein
MEDGKGLVMSWQEKTHNFLKISQKLSVRVGQTCSACCTVTDWFRKLIREESLTQRVSPSKLLLDNRIDVLIANVLEQAPFIQCIRSARPSSALAHQYGGT